MALDDLQGVIERLRDRIKTHRSYLSGDETRTRQVLIDPLLRELGWDVSDPDTVELEYRVGQQRADYALMSGTELVAVIEAKRLGRDLEDDEIMQVLNYANRDGIDYMIVTDGDKWEMYEVFKRGTLEERLLMKFQLSQQPPHKNASQARAMRKPNLTSKKPVFVRPKPPRDKPRVQPPIDPSKDTDNWCSFEEKIYPPYTDPAKLKIGNSPAVTVKSWTEAIHKVVAWLADEGKLSVSDSPIGTDTYTFIGPEAVNPNGKLFKDPQRLSNGLILQRGDYMNTREQWYQLRQLLWDLEVNRNTTRVSYEPLEQTNR